jgi:hypothetical protein
MPTLSSFSGGSVRGYGFGSKKAAVAATGGTETTVDGYKYHKFTSTSNFVVTAGGKVDYMILGGGYGGLGYQASSGGGAAASFLEGTEQTIGTGTMLVTVGGSDTQSSVAFVTHGTKATTGRQGYGQSGNSNLRAPTGIGIYSGGASGGGAVYGGGGGAGMGGDGGNSPGTIDSYVGGNGGPGIQRTTFATATSSGVSNYYGGGGGGHAGFGPAGSGGSGGGGGGGGGGGAANTGSGGGGSYPSSAGAGGSGIVIIRYPV